MLVTAGVLLAPPLWAQDVPSTEPAEGVEAQPTDEGQSMALTAASDEPDDGDDEEAILPDWLELEAEYRIRSVLVDPFELSGTTVRDVNWHEHRARIDLGLRMGSVASLHLQTDLLDGVLFGDNGRFGSDPSPISGVSLTARRPNDIGWEIGLQPGADPLDPDSYVPRLRAVDPIQINWLYADVYLPIGLLRFGRQPLTYGPFLSAHIGTRTNRWGVSQFSDSVDRILFATKLDAVAAVIGGADAADIDTSQERGVFLGLGADWLSQGDLYTRQDGTLQLVGSIEWRVPEADWFGADVRDFNAAISVVHLLADQFDTNIWSFPTRVEAGIGPVWFILQYSVIVGDTREIAEGFAVLSGRDPNVQHIIAHGAQGIVDWRVGPLTFTLEADYASGDADPRPTTDLTIFSFSRDLNVGLLLFEHLMAFETARSVAVGFENLASLDADSFPLTEVSTEGRFTNAIALFPQVAVDIVDTPAHHLLSRLGVLMAWPEADGVVDPIVTILAEDGNEIADDAVNFHGGDPGSYYGTEIDAQVQWTYEHTCTWTIEGAVLFPGSSLEDEHGDAVESFLFENRFLVVF